MIFYKKRFSSVIVVPTFNNYQDIKKLSKYFKKSNLKNYFICFVDDSFDKTVETVTKVAEATTKYATETVKTASANVKLANSAQLSAITIFLKRPHKICRIPSTAFE